MIGRLVMHVLGLDNLSGPWYGFWSGFGSDIAEFSLIGVLIRTMRNHHREHMAELRKQAHNSNEYKERGDAVRC